MELLSASAVKERLQLPASSTGEILRVTCSPCHVCVGIPNQEGASFSTRHISEDLLNLEFVFVHGNSTVKVERPNRNQMSVVQGAKDPLEDMVRSQFVNNLVQVKAIAKGKTPPSLIVPEAQHPVLVMRKSLLPPRRFPWGFLKSDEFRSLLDFSW